MVLQKNLSFFSPTSTDIILALFTLITLVVGDSVPTTLVKSICGKTRSEHPVIYDANFGDAMSVVSQQIAVDRFGSAESGNGSDRIYGLGQCFGHVSLVQCRLCYDETRVKLPLCMPNISSRIYLDGCFLRNDNHNFSDEVMDSMDTHVCDYRANSSNSIRFGEIASRLVRNLSLEAPQEKGYFKIGSSRGSKIAVFALVQCWRSVNKSACGACLENASERALGCLPASDGRGLKAGCYVRYSNTKFYEENSSSRDGSLVVLRRLGAALGSIFAGVVIIVGVILYKRRRIGTSARFDDKDGSSEIIKPISESHLGFKYEVLRKATKDFHEGNKLGQGGFGSVYKGVLPDGREVAIKRLFFNTRQWVDQFFNEVNLISKVQHKNLVKLIGCSVEGPESLLVYEYLSNTNLDKFLFDSIKKRVLDWGRRMDIIVGTAEGLSYLHEASEVRIIHRDIKASNILLDEKFKPKIADFGLARYFAEDLSHISTGIAGTLGYMSPEYVVLGQLTEKADIYSYGVLVLEMITGKKNTSSISTSKEGHSLLSLASKASVTQRIEVLKEGVKDMLNRATDSRQKMNLVDTIDRLGLTYHFSEEIQAILQSLYEGGNLIDNDLHVVALRFRLLRRQGYYVPLDVFDKFKDKEGKFDQSLRNDIRGLLSLYEASHHGLPGENILDEALAFTTEHLKSMSTQLDPTLAKHVEHSLELPLHRRLPRLDNRYYISFYEETGETNHSILELAKLDFNLVQSLHQSEIKEVSRWWKDMDLAVMFPFARDHVVECYTWGAFVNYLPQFSNGRKALAKCISLISLTDDSYDIYGTIEELELFTEAIDRFDVHLIWI